MTTARIAVSRETRIRRGDASYPGLLERIHQPPEELHVVGDPRLLAGPSVAVVGSRRASREGLILAEGLAADLAARGLVVVSGLASGIDAAAHRGALAAGRTVAVLASGVDVCSPRSNRSLYERIAAEGALVSELEAGTPPLAHHFLRRNRIISGLTLGTVVVEAAERSGALITARHAREQDREVFAVPGSPLRETSAGANALLKDGAALVRDWRDVVIELESQLRSEGAGSDTRVEARELVPSKREAWAAGPKSPGERGLVKRAGDRLLTMLGGGPTHVDDLQAACGDGVGSVLAELSQLEILGLVRQLPGKYFVRVPPSRSAPRGQASGPGVGRSPA